jgi:hypothetical protein
MTVRPKADPTYESSVAHGPIYESYVGVRLQLDFFSGP